MLGSSSTTRIFTPCGPRRTGAANPTTNSVPSPGEELTSICPPWARTMEWTVDRPRPVPPGRLVKKGSKMRGRSAVAMLPPESQTWIRTWPSTWLKKVRTRPPFPAAASALRRRFRSTCRTWSGSTSARSPPGATSILTPQASGIRGEQLDGLPDQLVQLAGPPHRRRRPGEARKSLTSSPSRSASRVRMSTSRWVRVRPGREQLRRATHRGQRVADLVRQLGGERAQLRQPVRPAQLLLCAPEIGEVLEDDQERRRRSAQRGDREPEDAPARRAS